MALSRQKASTLAGLRVLPTVNLICSLNPCTESTSSFPHQPIPTIAARSMKSLCCFPRVCNRVVIRQESIDLDHSIYGAPSLAVGAFVQVREHQGGMIVACSLTLIGATITWGAHRADCTVRPG